jgi:hypothetical protein
VKFYSPEDCRRKADQHWEMAALARRDRDMPDVNRHTALAKLWEQRAKEGGYTE